MTSPTRAFHTAGVLLNQFSGSAHKLPARTRQQMMHFMILSLSLLPGYPTIIIFAFQESAL